MINVSAQVKVQSADPDAVLVVSSVPDPKMCADSGSVVLTFGKMRITVVASDLRQAVRAASLASGDSDDECPF